MTKIVKRRGPVIYSSSCGCNAKEGNLKETAAKITFHCHRLSEWILERARGWVGVLSFCDGTIPPEFPNQENQHTFLSFLSRPLLTPVYLYARKYFFFTIFYLFLLPSLSLSNICPRDSPFLPWTFSDMQLSIHSLLALLYIVPLH